MAATQDIDTDWTAQAVRMRQVERAATADIAAAVGRSESQVRKVLAKANAERAINGHQTTVEEHLAEEGIGDTAPPEDDPEHPDTLAEFRAEAGEAVGPMPPVTITGPTYADVSVEELRLDGTTQYALDLGGDVATEATVTFTGTFPSGFFRKGHVFGGTFEARIVGVNEKDKLDKASRTFRPGPQKYVAQITDLTLE